jgi:pimeloyl-ACP methyl ester carboxylesterase
MQHEFVSNMHSDGSCRGRAFRALRAAVRSTVEGAHQRGLLGVLLPALMLLAGQAFAQTGPPSLELRPCGGAANRAQILCGEHSVAENRDPGRGRQITLGVIVLPALASDPEPDPLFILAGGPGQAATDIAPFYLSSWKRQRRDVVFVDQRGSAGDHMLQCALSGSETDAQGYLEPLFQPERFRACRRELQRRADLRMYTTSIFAEDLDEVRTALGYDRINLSGTSYGTRAALVYLRQYPERVRSVVLNGASPLAYRNPLHHAREAETAIRALFAECAADRACAEAYPRLAEEWDAIVRRLGANPPRVAIRHPATGAPATVRLNRTAFTEAVRALLYGADSGREVPWLVHRVYRGDDRTAAELAAAVGRNTRHGLRFGLMLSVICSEDVPRIDPAEIGPETDGTFGRDERVRTQMAACATWPTGEVPAGYGEPVRSDVPVLVLSGTLDPVTGARWGEETVRHLPNGRHVVVPGAHGVRGPCVDRMVHGFLAAGSARDLDTSCVDRVRLPPFRLPREDR